MEDKNNCIGGACLGIYEVKNECGIAACPSVYEVRSNCGIGVCPSIHAEEHKDKYYVVGRQLNEKEIRDLGLAKKVGKGEAIIEVPKSLLENL